MSFNNKDLPLIYALPKGANFWRIDWFDELAFPNRMMRRTQPSLLLHLSRVLDEKFLEEPAILLSPNATTTARQQRKVWVPTGYTGYWDCDRLLVKTLDGFVEFQKQHIFFFDSNSKPAMWPFFRLAKLPVRLKWFLGIFLAGSILFED